MQVKAAASVGSLKGKEPVSLTAYDIKIIQYKSGLYKLQEITRIIGILEKNLLPKSTDNKDPHKNTNTIIPLINYILPLCEGHIFNIHPMIRKRYSALCQFKFYKLQDFNLPLSTTFINTDFDFPPVLEDSFEEYRQNIYNNELQWKLLHYLKNLTVNTISVYNRRLRQIQLEKSANSNRPYEVTTKYSKFNVDCVDDLIRPTELGLSLDFAVLIKDKIRDTSLKSFLKLQWQVTDRTILFIEKKIFPNIKNYYNQINKYSNQVGSLESLPSFEFTLHRIYALLLKVFDTFAMVISLIRCIYLPNKSYFQDVKTKLISKNVYQYEEAIKKMDALCLEYKEKEFCDFKNDLNSFHINMVTYVPRSEKEIDTISDLHKKFIAKYISMVRTTLQIISKWSSMWKFIQNNLNGLEKFKLSESNQLTRMLEERRSVDKLSHFEQVSDKKRNSVVTNSTTNNNISSNSSSTKSSRTSSLLSYSLHPDEVRMLNNSATLTMSKMKMNSSHGSTSSPTSSVSSLSPINTSRRSSVDRSKLHPVGMNSLSRSSSRSRSSNTSSPAVSRRSSIIERSANPIKVRPLSTVFDEPTELPDSNKKVFEPPVVSLKRANSVKGRPRSSSLQTPKFSNPHKTNTNGNSDYKRSNSLEANDALNQKLVQDTMKKLMSGSLGRHITHSDGTYSPTMSRSTSRNRSRSSSVNSDSSFNLKSPTSEKMSSNKLVNNNVGSPHRVSSPLVSKFRNLDLKDSGDITPTLSSPTSRSAERLQFQDFDSSNTYNNNSEDSEGTISSTSTDTSSTIKKVRFVGVPPMSAAENPRPKRKGWYKKPAVLHYPPIPPQVNISLRQKYNLEGVVFRKSLRDISEDEKKPGMMANLDEGLVAKKSSPTHKFGLNIRDRFRSS